MEKNIIRHGDLLLVPQNEVPKYLQENAKYRKADGVLARGEATGHAHRLTVPENAEVFDAGFNGMYVRVGSRGVSIVHEEHKSVRLEPNTTYKVHRAREYDYLGAVSRTVSD